VAQPSDKKAAPKDADGKTAEIGILTVTEFHQRLKDLCVHPMIQVYYKGPLARPKGVGGIEVAGRPADATSWNVTRTLRSRDIGIVLFTLTIGLEDNPGSVGVCTVGGTKLYLYVSQIRKDGKLDDKVFADIEDPPLPDLTFRDLVKKIADK
jgi:hypothetical protein